MKLNEISENISHTSKRLRDIERKKGVKPGTPEWFKLWFSLPYLKESALHEGYKIQLERGKDMDVLHIVDTKTNKRTEVRGKPGYETAYDPNDSLHQLIDKIGKAANISELINGEVVTINPHHPDSNRANAETDRAFNEDVSVPENIFHMKNRLLKVKKITDAMGNRPIMFRSFVYDAEPVAKIIKKVTNDSARSIKTGSNQKQNEVLQKLGIANPTFAAMANSKYANVKRDSLEDHEIAGLQNIFIPMSNEIYYSDAIEDLGMGRKSGGRNIAVQSDFDVDAAVATYKKGWPSANFDNEIIVDTKEYYLLNLRSFLLELTSPEIKDQIKRLKSMYNKSYEKRAEENHINDIMKDIFKTKITTYSDISNWISNVAVPFVDMLAANRGEPTNNDDDEDDDDDWFDYNIDIDDYDNDDELKLESVSSKATTATITAFNEDVEVDLHGNAERGYVLSKISVSADQRGQGRGTEIMQQIVDRMDKEGAVIALTPDTVFGGAKGKLIDFYKRFGFVPNKGRNKDFRFRETMIRYPKQINEENIYDILEPEDCGPFDGGCVLVAQALQQIHGGEIVVLINDRGIADHAAVKVGNTLIDYDGPLPVDKFIKRFEKNELVNITGMRSMKSSDLPGATRNQSLLPKIVNLLSKKKKYSKINEETGKEMLSMFQNMHHDTAMNKEMDQFILAHDWELRDFTPEMFPSEEEFFDYDDPFDRVIDIDYSHRVDLSQPIIVGPQYSDGKYSVIDGNHRAARAQSMGKTIKGYFPVTKVTEALDQPYPYSWGVQSEDEWVARAKTESGAILDIRFEYWDGEWDIEFLLDGGYKATAAGDQFRIFATVVAAIKEWWKSTSAKGIPVSIIRFSADKLNDKTGKTGSREKLYRRFAQQFANSIGFTVQRRDKISATDFELVNTNYNEHKVNEAEGKIKYNTPNFEYEWEEAERYPEFVKIGKSAWTELAKKGKAITITSAKGINNTDAADPDSFKSLDVVKQGRALDQLKSGTVEMPIIAVYSDGWKELIGGNTRLTAMLAQNGRATVWAFKVPDEVAELAENFADGKVKETRSLTPQISPLRALVLEYLTFTSTGIMTIVSDGAKSPQSAEELKKVFQTLNQSNKNLQSIVNNEPKLESNKTAILKNIHDMMTYAVAHLKANMIPQEFDAKKKQINSVLIKYNNVAKNESIIEAEGLGLTIFDIDETLMRTTAQIKVVKDGKTVRSLTNQEFNNYKLQPGEEFDFGEFRNAEKFARESEPIAPMIAKLKSILRNAGDSRVIMLTARADFDDKETFLNTFRKLGIDMSRVHVHRAGNLGGSPAQNKEVFIRQYLDTGKYARVRLYDDAMSNIKMFNQIAKDYPDIKFYPYLVTHEGGIKTVRENDPNKVVTELLNTQAKDAKWTMSGEDMSRMEFTASNGVVYEIDFLAPYIGPDEIYPTDFVPDMPKDQIEQAVFVEFSQKNAAGVAKQGVAGTGAAAEVFGIVTNAILEFARKRKPSMLYFQAAEPNRQKLYAAIVNRLVKSMTGYNVKRLGDKFAVYSNNIGENFTESEYGAPFTFKIKRRKLNVPALIKAGAIFITYPHGEQGWETDDNRVWSYSLISLYNVQGGGWPKDAKNYLKPQSYKRAEQQINSSAPNLGSDQLVYDGKYNQILWSIKKLGIPDNVAFLDNGQQDVAENFADGKNPGRKGLAKRMGVNTKASVSSLRKTAKNSSGEKQRMAHWLANMKAGKAKKK